jgi:hypothetical protein
LLHGEVGVAARQGQELVGVIFNRGGAAKQHELAHGAVRHGRSEALLRELCEASPRRRARGEFQPVIPELCGTSEVHQCVPDATALWCALAVKERFAPIEPGQGIFFAVVGWELQADARVEAGVCEVVFLLAPLLPRVVAVRLGW